MWWTHTELTLRWPLWHLQTLAALAQAGLGLAWAYWAAWDAWLCWGDWAGCNAALPCSKDYLHVKDDPNNLRYGIYNRWIVFLWSRPCRRHSFRTLLFKIPFESNCLSITAYKPACQVPSIAIRLCEELKKILLFFMTTLLKFNAKPLQEFQSVLLHASFIKSQLTLCWLLTLFHLKQRFF